MKIYLAGNISENPQTYLWRVEFAKLIKLASVRWDQPSSVLILDPCRNQFNQRLNGFTDDSRIFVDQAKKQAQHILRPKDYQLVKQADIVVVNFQYSSEYKPMVATIMELTWAADIFYLPIIGIFSATSNIYSQHPWIDEVVSYRVESVEAAVSVINDFFSYE
jgi:nucleoside 2-deoxyribosyltransferase